jgi:hypothetical protein
VFDITIDNLLIVASLVAGLLVGTHILVSVITILSLKQASKERQSLHRELFGLVKKIEGLTASRREQMLKHYDGLLETLSTKLPTAVANHTGQMIFDTESKILARLAEIEPGLAKDEAGKEKLNDLIKSMEVLERSLVNLTSDAVRDVMIDGRRSLFEGHADLDLKMLS